MAREKRQDRPHARFYVGCSGVDVAATSLLTTPVTSRSSNAFVTFSNLRGPSSLAPPLAAHGALPCYSSRQRRGQHILQGLLLPLRPQVAYALGDLGILEMTALYS